MSATLLLEFEEITEDNLQLKDTVSIKDVRTLNGFKDIDGVSMGGTYGAFFFYKMALTKDDFRMILPFAKVDVKNIEIWEERDTEKENKRTAMSFFAGYGPMSTYKFENTHMKIPYEEDGKPKDLEIVTDKAKRILKHLKAVLPEEFKEAESADNADPVQRLKNKFVDGEISEEEYKKKLEVLERE